jgi:hypothetical protein
MDWLGTCATAKKTPPPHDSKLTLLSKDTAKYTNKVRASEQ